MATLDPKAQVTRRGPGRSMADVVRGDPSLAADDGTTPDDGVGPGDTISPGDSMTPGDTISPGDSMTPGDTISPGDTMTPADTVTPEVTVSSVDTLPPDTPRVAGLGPSRPWVVRSGRDRRSSVRLRLVEDEGVVVIDDRRLPGGRATIDMIAVGPAGVFVIETRKSKGLVHTKRRGPVSALGPDELHVGRRNCMDWVAEVAERTDVVRSALATEDWAREVPVLGMLCLTRAAWGFATPIEVGGVWVGWPRLVVTRLRQPDLLDSPLVNEVSGLISAALG
jgi:hypothetical protein